MATETETDTDPSALISERVAGGILPKVLTTFDMVAIFVAIVLFITNAAVIQSAGPAAFGWWILGFLVFLIPGAIVTGQLGRMFPGEGSIYLWTNKAFGSFWVFLGAEVPLTLGLELKDSRAITRYLLFGSLAVMAAYLIATFGVMVVVPAANSQSAQVTAVAAAVGLALGDWLGKLVALILAGFF